MRSVRSVDEKVETNLRRWDEMAALHLKTYGIDDPNSAWERGLVPFEHDELGDVRGQRICHLQCHLGGDSLALARMGAEVVGVDFSPRAIETASARATSAGMNDRARFVVATVDEAPGAVGGHFDGVYTSWGVLCWLPDLSAWAATVASLLADGGWLYLAETHPYAYSVGNQWAGYGGGQPQFSDAQGDYTDADALFDNPGAWEWAHGLGDIVSAVAGAGLRVEWLHEHPVAVWHLNRHDELVQRADGLWEMPSSPALPLSFTLRACTA